MPLRSIRINVPETETSQPEAATTVSAARTARNEPYTDADLQKAWDDFMVDRPTEHILVNTMRASRPQPTDRPGVYSVTVENQGQHELLDKEMPELLKSVRNAVNNDSISFVIAENEGAGKPITWNEREILAYINENHPAAKTFIKALKLSLT